MQSMWKVRALNAAGDLEEAHFVGTLGEVATAFADASVRVVQWAGDVAEPAVDAAKGGESVTIEKSDVGDGAQLLAEA